VKKNRHTPEQIVCKLREAEAKLTAGASVAQVAKEFCVSEATFHRSGESATVACRWTL
jgi:putative transposase